MCFSRRLVIVDRDPIRRHTFHSRRWLNNYSRRGQYGWFGSHTGRGQRRKARIKCHLQWGFRLGMRQEHTHCYKSNEQHPPKKKPRLFSGEAGYKKIERKKLGGKWVGGGGKKEWPTPAAFFP